MPTYNKLVRDRIPEIIANTGKDLKTELLSDERYAQELRKKLNEEVAEYQEAKKDEDAIEELADVLELMHALASIHGATMECVECIRQKKAHKRGGFENKVFLIVVDDD